MNIEDYGYKKERKIRDNLIIARIIETNRGRYDIVCDKGIKTAVLKSGSYYDNPEAIYPTIGDFVWIDWNESGESLIYETVSRDSSFSRMASSNDRRKDLHEQHEQLVAANFDYVFIMQSLNGDYSLSRVERYLTLAWESGAIPVIVLTKADLVSDTQDYINEVSDIAFGVDVYAISTVTGQGLTDLEKYFKKGNTIVFLGSSGVGKSTLVNTLMKEEVMKTSTIREEDSKGRHTTTNRQLLMLPNGTMIIDTPGMRELGMWDANKGLSVTFCEIEDLIEKCKFSNCTHTNEPGCAILEAIGNGVISKDRYNSYLKLKQEMLYSENSEEYLRNKEKKFKQISKTIKNIKK